ncbi:hypothetical protein [Georgenia sunbinii]|uniref:hypothetical protein n=1 Tax=Georgenia sunbinii TaxID=3117728 RepID=UPI002F26C2F0
MTSSLVTLAAETEVVNELPMPPFMYGIIALGILMFLLLFTLAYRNIHTRNR